METAVKSKQNKKKAKHVRVPVKRTLNLATVGEKKINLLVAIPAILLIIAVAALLSKLAVVDRYRKVTEAQQEVASLQREVDNCYQRINSYGEINELYAHFTYSDMTEEEISRANRVAVADLIWRDVLPDFKLESWIVKENKLELTIKGSTLEQINELSQRLLEEPNVDYCSVMTAITSTYKNDRGVAEIDGVDAKVTVFLNNDPTEEEDAK